jgi:hypothetical protein
VLPHDSASVGGATPLRGKDFRDAVKAAQSRLHAAQRNGKGRYRAKSTTPRPKPGMNRRQPPGGAA